MYVGYSILCISCWTFIFQITHSSGNHAQALAWAANMAGIPCTVVVPNNTPITKINAMKSYGANVVLCEPTVEGRYANTAMEISSSTALCAAGRERHMLEKYSKTTLGYAKRVWG